MPVCMCLYQKLADALHTLEGTRVKNSAGMIWSVSMFCMGSHHEMISDGAWTLATQTRNAIGGSMCTHISGHKAFSSHDSRRAFLLVYFGLNLYDAPSAP
eukprot:scaffold129107_cov21-Tisochrysis_lutea.AAC.1